MTPKDPRVLIQGGAQQQALGALQELEYLYLEEESLSPAALAFVPRLPRLRQLGLQDLPITDEELAALRRRFPSVDVGR